MGIHINRPIYLRYEYFVTNGQVGKKTVESEIKDIEHIIDTQAATSKCIELATSNKRSAILFVNGHHNRIGEKSLQTYHHGSTYRYASTANDTLTYSETAIILANSDGDTVVISNNLSLIHI